MIPTQPKEQDFYNKQFHTIKRLTQNETKAESLSLPEMEVQLCIGTKNPDMPEESCLSPVLLVAVSTQRESSLRRDVEEDMAYLKKATRKQPGPQFGGFNTQRARKEGAFPKSKTALVYTPVPFLDMFPTEPDTMKTAMIEAQCLTVLTG